MCWCNIFFPCFQGSRLREGEVTWQTEVAEVVEEEVEGGEYYYPPTLRFPSPDLAVVSDGRGRVSVLRTNDRSATHSWVVR